MNPETTLRVALVLHIGAIAFSSAYFGPGDGPVWLRNVVCDGTEQSLANCSHEGLIVAPSYCNHFQDASVQCPGQHSQIRMPQLSKSTEISGNLFMH